MSHKIFSFILFTGLLITFPTLAEQATKPLVKPMSDEKAQAAQEIERLKVELATLKTQKQAGNAETTQQIELPEAAKIDMVQLPSGISFSKYEITRGQFSAFVEETGYNTGSSCWIKEKGEWSEHSDRNWKNPGSHQENNHPVVCVNFADTEAYIQWLNNKTGKRYRLPSQDEWYSACQAGGYNSEYCGSNTIDPVGWYEGNSGGSTHSVGLRQPNAYGLFDMSGNVWEWTATCYELDCTRRVARGGSWGNEAGYARAEALNWNDTPARYDLLGFRIVLEP
jgi:formylglycine-generating enzyme required for sulfatase activity